MKKTISVFLCLLIIFQSFSAFAEINCDFHVCQNECIELRRWSNACGISEQLVIPGAITSGIGVSYGIQAAEAAKGAAAVKMSAFLSSAALPVALITFGVTFMFNNIACGMVPGMAMQWENCLNMQILEAVKEEGKKKEEEAKVTAQVVALTIESIYQSKFSHWEQLCREEQQAYMLQEEQRLGDEFLSEDNQNRIGAELIRIRQRWF